MAMLKKRPSQRAKSSATTVHARCTRSCLRRRAFAHPVEPKRSGHPWPRLKASFTKSLKGVAIHGHNPFESRPFVTFRSICKLQPSKKPTVGGALWPMSLQAVGL